MLLGDERIGSRLARRAKAIRQWLKPRAEAKEEMEERDLPLVPRVCHTIPRSHSSYRPLVGSRQVPLTSSPPRPVVILAVHEAV